MRDVAGTSLSVALMMLALTGYSQEKSLNYHILRNGNSIGTLRFSETISAGMDSLKMESNIKTKSPFIFVAQGLECAIFRNGVLLRSSIYRQLNGRGKANKQHKADNGQYIVYKGKNSKIIKEYPITHNMLSLYSKEPENFTKVYSDNFETFLGSRKSKLINTRLHYSMVVTLLLLQRREVEPG